MERNLEADLKLKYMRLWIENHELVDELENVEMMLKFTNRSKTPKKWKQMMSKYFESRSNEIKKQVFDDDYLKLLQVEKTS